MVSIFGKLSKAYYERKARKCIKKMGANCKINGSFKIVCPEKVVLGENVHLGSDFFVGGCGGLEIGDNTHISRDVMIWTWDHNYEGKRLPYDEVLFRKKVIIGRNVWIGARVSIAPGTEIGEGAVIGTGSVLAGKIPPLAIVVSPKYRIIKYRDKKHYERLEREKSYGGVRGRKIT